MSGEKKLEFNDGEDAMLMKNYLRLVCAGIIIIIIMIIIIIVVC